jgi:ribosomal-protein-alanine N-acetyltransferase
MSVHHRIEVGDEIHLTEVRWCDAQSFVDHLNDEEIHRNTLKIPKPYTLDDALHFIQDCRNFEQEKEKQCSWVIRRGDDLIGGIGILFPHGIKDHKCEIGYWLAKGERRKGIMPRVIQAFSDFLMKDYGYTRIEAKTFPYNPASAKVLERAGFVREGRLRSFHKKDGGLVDSFLYAKVKG